jgi:hypothetical protein
MAFTADELRAAIRLVGCDHDPLCYGFRWKIKNERALAQMVSWTLQGHSRHAERVLTALCSTAIQSWSTVKQQAIDRLTLPTGTGNEALRWHRDGLVFQHIAWLAAVIEKGDSVAASIPHLIPAHKGFDALLVPLRKAREAIGGIIICEDKATTNPRTQITNNVWPSILSVDAGERDAELNGELTAILQRYNIENIEQVLSQAHWLNRKAYRVSITVAEIHEPPAARRALFEGYDDTAPGDLTRRQAETLLIPHLRRWMDNFCMQVIAAIRETSNV